MIRRLLNLAIVSAIAAAVVDRWLAARSGTRPPTPIRSMVVVDAPIAETWSVLVDIPLQVEWMQEMKQVTVTTPGPVGVGTRGTAIVRAFGVPIPDPVEVVEFQPPTRYAIAHHGPFRGRGLITLEPGADGTTTIVRWEEVLHPVVLPELGARVVAPVLRPIFQADLHRFRRLVETGSGDA